MTTIVMELVEFDGWVGTDDEFESFVREVEEFVNRDAGWVGGRVVINVVHAPPRTLAELNEGVERRTLERARDIVIDAMFWLRDEFLDVWPR